GRHQVRRELDSREADAGDLRISPRDQRLGEPREVLDQDVAVREQPEQDELERVSLADDGPLDLDEDSFGALRELSDGHSMASSRSRTRWRVAGARPGRKRWSGAWRVARLAARSAMAPTLRT